MTKTTCYLGLEKKLRNGGRYGVPSNLIKNARISDMDDLRAYMDLYMGKEDKKTWKHIYNFYGKVDSTQTGASGEGIDYIAVTIHSPGKTLPITIFLYETPDNKLNIYIPTRGNLCIGRTPILDCTKITKAVLSSVKGSTEEEAQLVMCFLEFSGKIATSALPKDVSDAILSEVPVKDLGDIFTIGPDKITISYNSEIYEIVQSMSLMIEDFSHRVVLKGSKPKTTKPKPVIGGANKELLVIHSDAENWLSHLFAWKTKGVYTGMTTDNPDISKEDAEESWSYPIYQFDKGVLHEDSRTGDRDSAVWRCSDWDEVYFEDDVIKKIKKLYPGIQPENIFLSDED